MAMDYIGPFTYNGIRSLIGGIVLIPVILISDANKKKRGEYVKLGKKEKKNLIVGGVLCGIAFALLQIYSRRVLSERTPEKRAL